jgi:hypothetical protein
MAVTRLAQGEQLAASFIRGWRDNDLPSARACALKISHLVVGTLLTHSRGERLIEVNMGIRKLPEDLWPEVLSAFRDGRDTIINSDEVRALYAPMMPANDNVAVKDDSIDAETLLGMTFTPLEYVIPGYVVEGLTVLGGKPKLGKSWWAYDASIAVATGGRAMGAVECEQGDVLYLALEDNQRRVQSRLETLCPTRKLLGQNLSRLTVRTIAPRIDNGLFAELDKWRAVRAKPRDLSPAISSKNG